MSPVEGVEGSRLQGGLECAWVGRRKPCSPGIGPESGSAVQSVEGRFSDLGVLEDDLTVL